MFRVARGCREERVGRNGEQPLKGYEAEFRWEQEYYCTAGLPQRVLYCTFKKARMSRLFGTHRMMKSSRPAKPGEKFQEAMKKIKTEERI